MKNLYSDLHPDGEVPGNAKTQGAERPNKIHIMFENDVGARGVKIQVRHGHLPAKISTPEPIKHNSLGCFSTVRAMS
jgi:hypothetical protein